MKHQSLSDVNSLYARQVTNQMALCADWFTFSFAKQTAWYAFDLGKCTLLLRAT